MVIFSPFLLTNKIVIIEDTALTQEALFKWLLKISLLKHDKTVTQKH